MMNELWSEHVASRRGMKGRPLVRKVVEIFYTNAKTAFLYQKYYLGANIKFSATILIGQYCVFATLL